MPRALAAAVTAAVAVVAIVVAQLGSSAEPGTGAGRRAARAAPSLGPLRTKLSVTPVQAGPALRGRRLPTNQWWTSALSGPWTSVLWAFPVGARAGPDGLALATAHPVASANAIVSRFAPALRIGGVLRGVEVAGYGAFSVTLDLERADGAPLRVVLAQGSPVVWVRLPPGSVSLDLADGVTTQVGGGGAVVQLGDQTWDLAFGGLRTVTRSGDELVADGSGTVWMAVAARPAGADASWPEMVRTAARRPLRTTRETLKVDWRRGVVHQQLRWIGQDGRDVAGPVALLPHQQSALPAGSAGRVAGTYATPRGTLRLVRGGRVDVRTAVGGLLPGVPSLPAAQRSAIVHDGKADAVTAPTGGSYAGPKSIWRLADLGEVLRRAGDRAGADRALQAARAGVEDWLTYSGADDRHWLAREPAWGGIVALPSEFGNESYNDHHFQYGYLIAAAAVIAESDPGFDTRYGRTVDLLADDVARVWNPYEGHSIASGFSDTPDGGNQESSSEAVNAWWAIARWELVTGRRGAADRAVAHYALEALAARTYWLDERDVVPRPTGYTHREAGIVWGGKVDFATFFDPRPEAVVGIQLLPFTFGSLYRADPAAARRRDAAVRDAARGTPRLWPDLFLMDGALADPAGAMAALSTLASVEPGNSHAFTRAWIATLDRWGPPRPAVHADAPYGLAFQRGYAVINPTGHRLTVGFRDGSGRLLRSVTAGSRAAVVVPR